MRSMYGIIVMVLFLGLTAQAQKISLDLENASVSSALDKIKSEGIGIAYSPSVLSKELKRTITIKCDNISPEDAINMIGFACKLKVKKINNKLFVIYKDDENFDFTKHAFGTDSKLFDKEFSKIKKNSSIKHSTDKNAYQTTSRTTTIINGKRYSSTFFYQQLTDKEIKRLNKLLAQIIKKEKLIISDANKLFGSGTKIECQDSDLKRVYKIIEKVMEDNNATEADIKSVQKAFKDSKMKSMFE